MRLVAKVGHQEEPYTPALMAPLPLSAERQVFALDFEPETADAKAGLAFILSTPPGEGESDVCFDDITLTGGS